MIELVSKKGIEIVWDGLNLFYVVSKRGVRTFHARTGGDTARALEIAQDRFHQFA